MSRLQKTTWNPALVAFRPGHVSWITWLLLSPLIYVGIENDNYGFSLGLAIGLSFMQAGYAWGQYFDHWHRFFMENRTAIWKSSVKNQPTKKIALTYVLAVGAKSGYTPIAFLVAIIALYPISEYTAIPFPFTLMIACLVGGVVSALLTNKLARWGEAKSKQLTDFSYVFESEPERQTY